MDTSAGVAIEVLILLVAIGLFRSGFINLFAGFLLTD